MVPFLTALILFLLIIMCVFLICLVLIQRGKGGGLAGALGGAGGSSAFGTKAGDVFTRVTMITAGIWIAMNMVLVVLSNQRTSAWGDTPLPGSLNKSEFSSPSDKVAPGDQPAPLVPPQTKLGVGSGSDALAPANINAPAPPPLGQANAPELPASPFATEPAAPPSPLPVGATPVGWGQQPQALILNRQSDLTRRACISPSSSR